MAGQRLIVELTIDGSARAGAVVAMEARAAMPLNAAMPMIRMDAEFPPTPIPPLEVGSGSEAPQRSTFALDANATLGEVPPSTMIVRVTVPDGEDPAVVAQQLKTVPEVVEVFADVVVQPCIICPGSPAMGTDRDVERLLDVTAMRGCGMDGSNVMVAIVDTGVNVAYLNSRGKNPRFDAGRSWVPRAGLSAGQMPVGHGTMCAYDVCIAAPNCTLLDVALLASSATGGSAMDGLLSDAVRAYAHLLGLLQGPIRPGENRSLVINNSWGMFHPSWDFPVGHPGNYSDNPNHPFNRIVATLAKAGADILFAAGNCGADCPDGRCRGVTDRAIYGANSHPDVTCVAGIDVSKERVGYSSMGPGRLVRDKPDVSGYTHFSGSGVYAADGGTSAATPVVAGVVAAIRSKRPYDPTRSTTTPAAIRSLLTSTAQDLGVTGYDYRHGWGAVNGTALRQSVCPVVGPVDICLRYPWICRPPRHICLRYPWLCRPMPPFAATPEEGPTQGEAPPDGEAPSGSDAPLSPVDAYWLGVAAGWQQAQAASAGPLASKQPSGCGCGGKSP